MIRTAEEESGLELVRRRPGGKFGGMAEVTDDCLELIRKYEELEKSAEQFVKAEYQRIFGEDVGKRVTVQPPNEQLDTAPARK